MTKYHMTTFYLATGFVIGACATAPLSQIIEYTLNPISHTLIAENGKVTNVGETDNMKCFQSEDLKSMKRYIVDIERQLIECQKK